MTGLFCGASAKPALTPRSPAKNAPPPGGRAFLLRWVANARPSCEVWHISADRAVIGWLKVPPRPAIGGEMRRRDLMAIVAVAPVMAPLIAHAQQAGNRMRRIGMLIAL